MKRFINWAKAKLFASEREQHDMQLAAISTAAWGNTESSRVDRIKADSPYWSTAYGDVCKAIDREMMHRNRVEELEIETLELRSKANVAEERVKQLEQMLSCPFEPREVDSAPPWTQDDAERWRLFLTCETGERLKRLLNFWSQWEEQSATLREDNFENACGQAKGFRRCAQYALQKLSADIRPQQDEDTRGQHGAADLRERYAP